MTSRHLSFFPLPSTRSRKWGWIRQSGIAVTGVVFLLTACTGISGRSEFPDPERAVFGPAVRVGTLENESLRECSGLAASNRRSDLLWAVNDSGNGPYLYALQLDGRDMGRIRVEDVVNRDWEGLDSFVLDGESFLLVADFGDNRQQHGVHTLVVVREPVTPNGGYGKEDTVPVAWRIRYTYPGRLHDAEAVAVDEREEKVFVLTKRDRAPVLYEVPLRPPVSDSPVAAGRLVAVAGIPQPTPEDWLFPYGAYRSQPTGMDIDPPGRLAVVLTYKDAYLFSRTPGEGWASAFLGVPVVIPLPPPQDHHDFQQRESLCFDRDGRRLFVTSEGKNAALYMLQVKGGIGNP
ncbi:MAG: esterase-like activity of phytase family protein [Desulfobacteraceae bacterium]|jgi:hypothetical protein|nr:esterase-like activity of phytase family protein [Desulfobacteraceae bacterium]